jgi:thioredoxin-like negative regulator of GroEL
MLNGSIVPFKESGWAGDRNDYRRQVYDYLPESPGSGSKEIYDLMMGAHLALSKRDYATAARYLLEILDMDKNNWTARLALAECYRVQTCPFAAQRTLQYLCAHCRDQRFIDLATSELSRLKLEIQQIVRRNLAARYGLR